ncbi:hypothetical protein [Aestuariivirga sp.]|uniref:hypothetical protein n=1 Tax=Aestuariivirga sp. TaxID=2650926 RepID=UPI0039E5E673
MRKNFRKNVLTIASIAFLASAAGAYADGLGGLGNAVGNTVGGLGNTVGNTVGGLGKAVGNTVGGVTKGVSTTASATVGTANSLVSVKADSALIGGIHARLGVLTPKQLVKLCVSAGGGKGCGTGTPAQVKSLIDARLSVLKRNQLIALCVSAGGSCGVTRAAVATPAQPPRTGDGGNGGKTARNIPLTCMKIMNSPASYEAGLVSLCRQMAAR